MVRTVPHLTLLLACFAYFSPCLAAGPAFFRGINLNGPPVTIDGNPWDGNDAKDFTSNGKSFENQKVPLNPPADADRTRMIRSSRWGGDLDVTLTNVPDGVYQIFVYVWEDNDSERFGILLNGKSVLNRYDSGAAGAWKKLGPFMGQSAKGTLTLSARGGAANFSGIEVWKGQGQVPGAPVSAFVEKPTPEQVEFFERRIRPVFVEHCYECHAGAGTLRAIKGGLLLDSRSGIIRGGDSGPVIVPGDPDHSRLITAIRHTDPELKMPKKKLPAQAIADLEAWVKQGAPDPRTDDTAAAFAAKTAIDWDKAKQWWSFRPLSAPAPPAVKNTAWPANDIDRFILAKLEPSSLAPPPQDADRRTLIRRATFDLHGLPPTPAEVAAFLADNSPEAFAKVIDRLLASPRYGERWGRHWLDVVRYADTAGDNSDFPIPQAYRYRNWVIDAFNRDLPYDEFVRQQIAGDLIGSSGFGVPGSALQGTGASTESPTLNSAPGTRHSLIATGYLASARRFGSRVDDYPWHLTIEDTIDNVGRAFLGLTINCARCHDHKFDPITATDYYALYGIFSSTRYPWPGIELEQKQRDLVSLAPDAEVESWRKTQQEKQTKLDAETKRLDLAVKAAQGDEKEKLEKQLDEAKKAAETNRNASPPYEMAYAVAEGKKPEDAMVQMKGDPAKPGPVVKRRFLTVLGGAELPATEKGSGRLQLAAWLTDRQNPLAARVMVNRIWQHHFGRGIVPTPNDFGRQGKPPTHPELLDYLASRFIAQQWSMKAMHRQIMLSRTYRQAGCQGTGDREQGSGDKEREAADRAASTTTHEPPIAHPDLFSPFPRRRLDAESIRDTLLMLGGSLELPSTPPGPHPFPPARDWKFTQHSPFKAVYETNGRSVYLMTQRIQRHPMLAIFDGADPAASTPSRLTTTTPVQALFLLNDPLLHEQSRRFAQRLLAEKKDDAARLALAYELSLSRPPRPEETAASLRFLESVRSKLNVSGTAGDKTDAEAWQAVARVMLRLNEFVYVD
jgi:hypothetical protein